MSIEMEVSLKNMGLASLVVHCSREMDAAARNAACDGRYWREWLSRAAVKRNDVVREALRPHLRRLLRVWLGVHPCQEQAYRLKSEEYYVARTCELFWQTVVEQKNTLDQLPMALRYLRASLNSVILDTLRLHTRSALAVPLDATGMEDQGKLARNGRRADWEGILQLLASEREQRIAYLLFTRGLHPKDILRLYPQEFSSLQEISRLRYAVMKHLLTDAGQ